MDQIEKVARWLCKWHCANHSKDTQLQAACANGCFMWEALTGEAAELIAEICPPGSAVRRREPTPEMIRAALSQSLSASGCVDIYKAMFDDPTAGPT